MSGNVNHPSHYQMGGVEVIDAIEAWGFGEGFNRGDAIKYIARAGRKNPESVYPTWTEYFRMIGLFPAWSGHEILDHTPIPADIAKQLGVKPKEG